MAKNFFSMKGGDLLFLLLILLFIIIETLSGHLIPPAFSFSPHLSAKELRLSIKEKRVVFIGDSVTRYQYLNLAFFLERGRWPDPFVTDEVMTGNPCCERSFANFSWPVFFRETNFALNGNELCDCWRSHQSVENRRYYNRKLNTHLIFIWFGSSPILMRKNFVNYPFRPIHDLTNTTKVPNITQIYDTFTVAGIIENVTTSFHPDLLFINWGHHHTFRTNKKDGALVYQELTSTLNKTKLNKHIKTRFIWKETAPTCVTFYRNNNSHAIHCKLRPNSFPSDLLSLKLIQENVLEMYNIHHYILQLYSSLPSYPDPLTSIFNLTNTATREDTYPIYWDRLHPHCWVMTQLNRMLLVTYFTTSQYQGVIFTDDKQNFYPK